MEPPQWQFWTDWAVKALGTLATFLAVFVALFGSRLRQWITPPQLTIKLSPEGMEAWVYSLDLATNQAHQETKGIWYRVQVENRTRATPVTGVLIFLLSIEAPDASGVFKPVWEGDAALVWKHDKNPQPKTIGHPAECDLCYILQNPLEVRVDPIIRGQVQNRFTGPLNLALTLQARGVEADSHKLRLQIWWNGKWSDDKAEMERHLVIKAV